MHPALFLLNSCILYVEQIIQKKGGDHSISVMFQSIRNEGVYDMKIYQDPGIQTIYRKE